jgi:hypothetical protein
MARRSILDSDVRAARDTYCVVQLKWQTVSFSLMDSSVYAVERTALQ